MSKITLGTVQFGMDYGISNEQGQVRFDEVEKILAFCSSNGIDTLDTAQGYGNSEAVLGNFDLSRFKIISKIMGVGRLESSLEALNVSNIYGLMFHRENECTEEKWKLFDSYKKQGLVKKIGVSVYSPDVLLKLIENFPIDIVQFPLNILDQRFIPLLDKLKEKRIEIYTRSVFLQGLLLMENIPPYFFPIKSVLEVIPRPRLKHAINFVKGFNQIDNLVLGVTSLAELKEIFDVHNSALEKFDYSKMCIADEKYINPSFWSI